MSYVREQAEAVRRAAENNDTMSLPYRDYAVELIIGLLEELEKTELTKEEKEYYGRALGSVRQDCGRIM